MDLWLETPEESMLHNDHGEPAQVKLEAKGEQLRAIYIHVFIGLPKRMQIGAAG